MTSPGSDLPLSLGEYLSFERHASSKHELVDGRAYMLAGASFVHNVIVGNVVGALSTALAHGACYTLPSDMKVGATSSRIYYPDASIVCGVPQFFDDKEDVLLNPSVVVEVLSDSTERVDRGEKFAAYTELSSLTDYVLIASKRVRVEHFSRAQGFQPAVLGATDTLSLASICVELNVKAFYARVFE